MSPGLDVRRASYRDLTRGRQLLSPGEVYELKLDKLITSNVFLKGHRIRLQVFSKFQPEIFPAISRVETSKHSAETKKAEIRIFHDGSHPSQESPPVMSNTR